MYKDFMRILRSSKRYEMDCDGCLSVTDYYTGETITLDLSRMSEEAFEEMLYDGDEEEEEDEYKYMTTNDGRKVHISEYREMVENGEGDWDFYSDWYKDVYGFRPRR